VIDLESGEIFGEEPLIFNVHHTRSVFAETPVICYSISEKDFNKRLHLLVPGLKLIFE
jgi:CRP-like cAMP-binding protein